MLRDPGGSTEDAREARRTAILRLQLRKDLLRRVAPSFRQFILQGDAILEYIDVGKSIGAAVLVMDMRYSTAMMLKTDKAQFAQYLQDLMEHMSRAVARNYGVFEKFTGDGFIAFYPKSIMTQPVAWAVHTAQDCLLGYREVHSRHQQIFDATISEFGLSFGIDYGMIYIHMINDELNISGAPVVYASRMASTKPAQIVLDHRAHLQALEHLPAATFEPVRVCVKHEPDHDGYLVCKEVQAEALTAPRLA